MKVIFWNEHKAACHSTTTDFSAGTYEQLIKGGSNCYTEVECESSDMIASIVELVNTATDVELLYHINPDPTDVLEVLEVLIDTVQRTTDLENVYNDNGELFTKAHSKSWEEVWAVYNQAKVNAGVE